MSSLRQSTGRRRLARRSVGMLACLFLLTAALTPVWAGPASGWVIPVDPPLVVVREFDPPPVRWLAGHRGVDLAATAGATVRATGPGRVTFAGLVAGRGVIVIRHGGRFGELRTTYEPVTASVVAGQQVAAGGPIGVVAATPRHCSPAVCLHWGLRNGDIYLDPRQMLEPAPIRLLPLGVATLPVVRHLGSAGSGPRMGLFVSPAQPLDRYVGVDLGRRE
jgi:murein DD-endopeptidase MepM/ murein hydrolase activator NlpD